MSEVDFDVIVVGAGVSGCVTSYLLAQQGLSVVLIERGESPGSKNLSGGIMYARSITEVFPNFLTDAPVERRIDRNRICFLNESSWVGVDYGDDRLYQGGTAVTVLRGRLDAWLAAQCEEAGVMVMPGVRVDGLMTEGNRIVGVQAGEDELHAHVVVAADGVNSFIARNAGLRATPSTDQLAVGIKALIKLPKADIEARFGVSEDHGVAYSLVGDCSQGVGGGGFLYTNRDSLSAGLVLRLDDLVAKGRRSIDLFDHFLAHPFIDQLVRGGELVEYGCHLVAEGGEAMQGQLVHNGLIIVGDAAGFTLNTGLTVRGMDLAVGSARAAAPAIAAAIADKDPSAARLAAYTENLKTSYVGQDMRTYAKAPHFLENERMYGAYGALLADVMNRLFYLDTSPRKHLVATAREALKASGLGLLTLGRDGWEGMRAL